MQKKRITALYIAFIVAVLFFVLKMLFCGLAPDEEYQITLSYRLAMGDGLFNRSWDTIQTSSFINYFLIKMFLFITGSTTGLVIFLRAFGIVFQFITSLCLFKRIKRILSKESALLISGFSFFALTKIFISPDFSNMLLWFLALMLCFLWDAYDVYMENGRLDVFRIVLSAIFFSWAVLAQACIILVPIVCVLLCVSFKKKKVFANLLFFGTCLAMAALYIGFILMTTGYDSMLLGIQGILNGDSSHSSGMNIMSQSKWVSTFTNACQVLGLLLAASLISALVAFLVSKIKKTAFSPDLFSLVFVLFSCIFTIYKWVIVKSGYDCIKLYLPALLVGALILFIVRRKSDGSDNCPIPFFGVLLGLGVFVNVVFVSNVPLINNLSFLIPAVVWGMVLIGRDGTGKFDGYIYTVLFLTAVTGTLFTLNSSPAGCTVLDCRKMVDYGPAKGVLTSEFVADVYNSECRSFSDLIPEGATVLIVSNYTENTLLNYCYLLNQVNISHYTVNSTPTYTQTLEYYWILYPEKYPDVIVVNNTAYYGWAYGWITAYLDYYYSYEEKVDTEYATYYFRKKQ